MRTKWIFTITFFSLIILTSCQNQTDTEFNTERETQAIKEVITKETESFFERDYEQWKNYWVKEDYSFRAGNGPDTTYAMYGWQNILDHIENYDQDSYEGSEDLRYATSDRENFKIEFNSETSATAKWEQYNLTKDSVYFLSRESRLLTKKGDAWKMVSVMAFWEKDNPIESLENVQ